MKHQVVVRPLAGTVSKIAAVAGLYLASATFANAAPPIRTNASNKVPACVSPERLMGFVRDRNPKLDPRYRDIARWYKYWGDAWGVRWDYAFFQMAIETNYLSYRRPDGRRGDVNENQNNFAGIGATGGGVPGNRFSDVATGVHAQIQHLVAYSGQRIAQPIAQRTEIAQDRIVDQSLRLQRPVTFGDLAQRWAVDRNYARSIDAVATQFRDTYCADAAATAIPPGVPVPQPARPRLRDQFPPPSGLGGPKPQRLAGPDAAAGAAEDLPWVKDTIAQTPDATSTGSLDAAQPANVSPPDTTKPSPVRTIWSREPQKANSDKASANRPVARTLAVETPIAKSAQPPKIEPQDTAAGEAETGPRLPTFRIAPSTPPPSRLGGPLPATLDQLGAPSPATAPCRIVTASYGGRKTLLLQATIDGERRLTALSVLDGFEKTMFETYARAAAPGSQIIGEYASQQEALDDAHTNCDNR